MKELVEYIVKQIVSVPEAVIVSEEVNGSVINLSLKVADEDMGIVIGKKGQTIRSIRTLLIVRAMNDGVRVNLTLIDARPQIEEQVDPSNEDENAEVANSVKEEVSSDEKTEEVKDEESEEEPKVETESELNENNPEESASGEDKS